MSDYEEIRQLVAQMAWYADTGQPEDVMSLWVDSESVFFDLRGTGGPLVTGAEPLRACLEGFRSGVNPMQGGDESIAPQKLHLVSNHVIVVDGDRATGRCAALGTVREQSGVAGHAAVEYVDEYQRIDGRWRFAGRTMSWLVRPEWATAGR